MIHVKESDLWEFACQRRTTLCNRSWTICSRSTGTAKDIWKPSVPSIITHFTLLHQLALNAGAHMPPVWRWQHWPLTTTVPRDMLLRRGRATLWGGVLLLVATERAFGSTPWRGPTCVLTSRRTHGFKRKGHPTSALWRICSSCERSSYASFVDFKDAEARPPWNFSDGDSIWVQSHSDVGPWMFLMDSWLPNAASLDPLDRIESHQNRPSEQNTVPLLRVVQTHLISKSQSICMPNSKTEIVLPLLRLFREVLGSALIFKLSIEGKVLLQ